MLRVLCDYKGGKPNPNRGTSLYKGPEAREDIGRFGELHIEYLDLVGLRCVREEMI